jgi:hypothetical protein
MLERIKDAMYVHNNWVDDTRDVVFKFGYKFNSAYETEEQAKEELFRHIKQEVYEDVEIEIIQVVISLLKKNIRGANLEDEIAQLQKLLEEIA